MDAVEPRVAVIVSEAGCHHTGLFDGSGVKTGYVFMNQRV